MFVVYILLRNVFKQGPQLKARYIPIKVKLVLVQDAQPNLFSQQVDVSPSPGPSKDRTAYHKRERKRVSVYLYYCVKPTCTLYEYKFCPYPYNCNLSTS